MPELIDRQAALEIVMSYCPDDAGCCSKAGHDLREMLDEIEALPVTEAEPMRYGRWIQRRNLEYYCSNCGREEKHIFQKNYCPRCGVKIDLRTPTQAQLDIADSVMMGDAENEI